MSNEKFMRDLARGHIYEKRSLLYLDYDEYKFMEGYHKEYDLEITKDNKKIKVEVKSDKQASHTGNLAIEYECNNKPSGITSSTAAGITTTAITPSGCPHLNERLWSVQ